MLYMDGHGLIEFETPLRQVNAFGLITCACLIVASEKGASVTHLGAGHCSTNDLQRIRAAIPNPIYAVYAINREMDDAYRRSIGFIERGLGIGPQSVVCIKNVGTYFGINSLGWIGGPGY
jgi:hypothetical protein